MKLPRIATTFLSLAFILGAGLEKSSAIPSPILLTIDDSNPSAVVITATGFAAGINDNSKTANNGIDLLGFFTANQPTLFGESLLNSTLVGGGSGAFYNNVEGDNFSTGGENFVDLKLSVDLSSPGEGNTQTFSPTQPAFTGSWTIDLSDLGVNGSALPAVGTVGDIFSGSSASPGTLIGQWEVEPVPEPGIGILFVLGSVMGMIVRRRRG